LLHAGAQPPRQPVSGGHGPAAAEVDSALLVQTPEKLADQKTDCRAPWRPDSAAMHPPLPAPRRRPCRQPRPASWPPIARMWHSRVAAPTGSPVPLARPPQCGRSTPTAPLHPAAGGQRPQRQPCAVIRPVDVLQHNRQRGFRSGRVDRVGQLVHHPVAQIGPPSRRMASASPTGGSARRVAMNREKNGTVC
jgi:hypothetical protein